MTNFLRTKLAVSLGALVLAACGTHAPPAVDASTVPRDTVTDSTLLLPGMLIEGIWQAGPNDRVGLSLDTSVAGLDWDIHGHANNGTQEVTSGFGVMTVSYDFHPPEQTQWYLLLRNSSTTMLRIDVHMDLFGEAQWVGWQ